MADPTLTLESPAFDAGGAIPPNHTCQGDDTSPPLRIRGVPPGTESLVLIVDDPDAPDPAAPERVFDHWVVYDIDPGTSEVATGEVPGGGTQGSNGWGRDDWGGPCPPIGRHRYFFKLACLDTKLGLPPGASKAEVERAMEGHVLAQAELMGTYEKS